MATKKCSLCGIEIINPHGSRQRHEDCAYEVKKARSISQYAKNQKQAYPYWSNDKILRDFFYQYGGGIEIDPALLENEGFDFVLYRKEIQIGDDRVFVMNKFGYSILRNKKIVIWKI